MAFGDEEGEEVEVEAEEERGGAEAICCERPRSEAAAAGGERAGCILIEHRLETTLGVTVAARMRIFVVSLERARESKEQEIEARKK